jgi:hypothetical protein
MRLHGQKSLTKLALYLTSAIVLNREAMSGGVLSDPLLNGSSFVQINTPNSQERPLMKQEAPRFMNKKHTSKNARGSKTSDKK